MTAVQPNTPHHCEADITSTSCLLTPTSSAAAAAAAAAATANNSSSSSSSTTNNYAQPPPHPLQVEHSSGQVARFQQQQQQPQPQLHVEGQRAHHRTTTVVDVTQVHHVTSTSNLLRMQDIQNLPTVSSTQILQGDTNQEEYKKNIYKHPLFPMLAMLFEKCELATAQPDTPPSDTFESDFHTFVQRQERENKAVFSDDEELNALMIKAIQVFRIHLQELQKVNELCKDFCGRYIACLKGKIQSESFLHDGEDPDSSPPSSAETSPTGMPPGPFGLSNGCYGSPATANGPMRGYPTSGFHGGRSLFSPSVGGPSPDSYSPPGLDSELGKSHLSHMGLGVHHSSAAAAAAAAQQQKRGVLPKRATQIMKQWLFQHLVHPYPTEDEKRHISTQTGLTLLQVNNWFINARRRILQPMLDASNPVAVASATGGSGGDCGTGGAGGGSGGGGGGAGVPSSAKKKKSSGHRPNTSRFWPPSLSTAVLAATRSGAGQAGAVRTAGPATEPGANPEGPTSAVVPPGANVEPEEEEEEEEEDEEEEEPAEEEEGASPRGTTPRDPAAAEVDADADGGGGGGGQRRRQRRTPSCGGNDAASTTSSGGAGGQEPEGGVKEEPCEAFGGGGGGGSQVRRSPPPLTPYQNSPNRSDSSPPGLAQGACDLTSPNAPSTSALPPASCPTPLMALPHNLTSAAAVAAAAAAAAYSVGSAGAATTGYGDVKPPPPPCVAPPPPPPPPPLHPHPYPPMSASVAATSASISSSGSSWTSPWQQAGPPHQPQAAATSPPLAHSGGAAAVAAAAAAAAAAVGSHHPHPFPPHGYYGPVVSAAAAAASYGPPGAHAAGAYYSLPPPPTSPYATHVGAASHPAGYSSVNDRGMLGHPHY